MAITARQAHRWNAVVLGAFLALHFASHLSAWGGITAHFATLESVRTVYRPIAAETVLLGLFASQLGLGLALVRRRPSNRRLPIWPHVQTISGVVLALFLVLHVGAAMGARHLAGIDTNFYWPGGTLVLAPLKYGFAPYYTIAVAALFLHLAAALHRHGKRTLAKAVALAGPLAGLALILPFTGALYAIELPPEYVSFFQRYAELRP